MIDQLGDCSQNDIIVACEKIKINNINVISKKINICLSAHLSEEKLTCFIAIKTKKNIP